MKRIVDTVLAVFLLTILGLPMLLLALMIKGTSKGPVFYWSDRVGKDNRLFKMCKFRTMFQGTPPIPTHLFSDAASYLTPLGSFLRKFSLDELPQLFNIISGDMTFVGPRPALFNQSDLIEFRTRKNVHTLLPGVTGWAQVNGRDDLSIPAKVAFDEYYLNHKTLMFDIKIVFLTAWKVIRREGVKI